MPWAGREVAGEGDSGMQLCTPTKQAVMCLTRASRRSFTPWLALSAPKSIAYLQQLLTSASQVHLQQLVCQGQLQNERHTLKYFSSLQRLSHLLDMNSLHAGEGRKAGEWSTERMTIEVWRGTCSALGYL